MNDDVVAKAQKYATLMHRGQKRWGGEDYITHPAAVAQAVSGHGPIFAAVAWLHDVLEDTPATFNDLLKAGIPDEVVSKVVLLSQMPGESYLSYILVILGSDDPVCVAVKKADLRHNLSTSEGTRHKTLRDKWQLALYILQGAVDHG